MISKDTIATLVENKLEGDSKYLVEVKVKPNNKITILLDDDESISINDCIEISKFIESNLDREKEDFELSVMSAGVGEPLKVKRQYKKNIGRQVEILTLEGDKLIGKLVLASDENIIIEQKIKAKAKIAQPTSIAFAYHQIKQTKVVLSF